ncbi:MULTISPECIES: hypothetical protein [unclassified Nostoc]|uniref:hypothetical protein n=1 Tax=unclassified Nostoc TaxID=2593658 RepID=UPI000B951604|nr:hypothetical protein [Nostoc sp. 'Peltigera membranacea cyanobiont' 232]OYE06857.1 hypothetical protein CDG79_00940 [Nostoc sp. 'Peltigera membranacea cyanobiont' 232]
MSNNQKFKYLSLAYCAYLALTIYWDFHYTGPVKFLGEMQMSLFGKQWQSVSLMILNLPVISLGTYLRNRVQSQNPDKEFSAKWNVIDDLTNNRLLKNALMPIIILIIGLIMLNITLAQSFSKDIGTINIAQLNSGKIAEHSFYANISGYPDPNALVTQKGNRMPRVYIALRENSQSNTPVHLIISLDKDDIEEYVHKDPKSETVTVSGFVTEGGEGEVRTWLEKQGVAIADSYWTIVPRVNLSNRSNGTYSSVFIPIAFISFAAFIFYRNSKEQTA